MNAIFYLTYRVPTGNTEQIGFRLTAINDGKYSLSDYWNWLTEKREEIQKEVGSNDVIITSHSRTLEHANELKQ